MTVRRGFGFGSKTMALAFRLRRRKRFSGFSSAAIRPTSSMEPASAWRSWRAPWNAWAATAAWFRRWAKAAVSGWNFAARKRPPQSADFVRPACSIRPLNVSIQLGHVLHFHAGAIPLDFLAHAGFHREIAEDAKFSQTRAVFEWH